MVAAGDNVDTQKTRSTPVAVGDGHELLGPVGADIHDDRGAQAVLLQAEVEVRAVRPDVDVVPHVHGGSVELRSGGVRRSGRRATVLTRGGLYLDVAGTGGDGVGLKVAVANDQAPALLVEVLDQPGDVGVDLRLEGCGQHTLGSVSDLIERRAHPRAALFVSHYSQYRRPFLAGVAALAVLSIGQEGKRVAPSSGSAIQRFRSKLHSELTLRMLVSTTEEHNR